MTNLEARRFAEDIHKELNSSNGYTDDVYLSIKSVGSKVFKKCKCDIIDGWLFIWTKDETFYVREKRLGDFVVVNPILSPELSLI